MQTAFTNVIKAGLRTLERPKRKEEEKKREESSNKIQWDTLTVI